MKLHHVRQLQDDTLCKRKKNDRNQIGAQNMTIRATICGECINNRNNRPQWSLDMAAPFIKGPQRKGFKLLVLETKSMTIRRRSPIINRNCTSQTRSVRVEGGRQYNLPGSSNEREITSRDASASNDETIFNMLDLPLTGEFEADANSRA